MWQYVAAHMSCDARCVCVCMCACVSARARACVCVCRVVTPPGRRYAFVRFRTTDQAYAALCALSKLPEWHGRLAFAKVWIAWRLDCSIRVHIDLCGQSVTRPPSTPVRNHTASRHLWVGNLYGVSKFMLHATFAKFPGLVNVHLLRVCEAFCGSSGGL